MSEGRFASDVRFPLANPPFSRAAGAFGARSRLFAFLVPIVRLARESDAGPAAVQRGLDKLPPPPPEPERPGFGQALKLASIRGGGGAPAAEKATGFP